MTSHENKNDQANQKNSYHLHADNHLILHTKIAQSLFKGTWKHGKMGLLQFAKIMSVISKAVKQDDPYADWYFFKTYQAIFYADETIKNIETRLTDYLNNLRGIKINILQNSHPIDQPLQFSSQFGFIGARLVANADYVIRLLLTLEKAGILISDEDLSIKNIVRLVQEVYAVPRGWRFTGVTRKDIRENNQKAQRAKEILGEIPESVFNKTIKFTLLPKVPVG